MAISGIPAVVGIGELLWDILPAGPRLGGATANFTVFCARLGNRAALITSVGTDAYGISALDLLVEPGLDLSQVQQTDAHSTGTVEVTFSPSNQPSYVISEGVAWDFIDLTAGVREKARSAHAICYGTLSQRNPASRATVQAFVEATHEDCVRVCDVNVRLPYCDADILRWSMEHATIIKISDEELPVVFRLLSLPPAAGPSQAAAALLQAFPQCSLVAMTLGPHGSLLTTTEQSVTHPGFPITAVDTVGAGDAFTAGLTHAYLRLLSLSPVALAKMAEIGNLCGSFVASRPAATPLLPPELLESIALKLL